MSKFVIFASARTGSTSLARVLGESEYVEMSIEPFHPDYSKWNPKERNYSEYIKDNETMNFALDEIFENYTAIKVLNYQFSEEIYHTLLTRKDVKIIFLKRNSIFEQVLSNLVAKQTSEWHKSNNLDVYSKLEPVDINEMKNVIDYVKSMNDSYFNFLDKNRKGDFVSLEYEKLYSEDIGKNTQTIKHICEFLEIAIPPTEAINKYMKPSEAKININNLYRNVPNIEDLQEKFGNL